MKIYKKVKSNKNLRDFLIKSGSEEFPHVESDVFIEIEHGTKAVIKWNDHCVHVDMSYWQSHAFCLVIETCEKISINT